MKIWMDGCFDMMHFGHANVFRQAKHLGSKLIVGVSSNEEIEKHKGICVMDDKERYFMVESCRWVDEIRRDVPYVPNIKYVLEQGCKLIVHGDDLAISVSGDDCYTEARKLSMYKEVSRTKFVSTTDMVGRMLLQRNINIDKAEYNKKANASPESEYSQEKQQYLDDLLRKFELPQKNKNSDQKAVYIDGTFDLFHPGHASLLKKCKDNGWFV
ncbi:Choline phosphate cytidylyltransferase/Predicted CDP-ethanolamine synthase, partial [Pseudoloma neurophilia]